MSKKTLTACPVCAKPLRVTRLRCNHCDTTIEGTFETCKFCQLTPEQRDFVEVFLTARGNIKEVERLLGISYPTVRSRLDTVIEALGYRVERDQNNQRRAILEALDKGEITSEEAIRLLKG
ncbi:MAG TPA: DUF2089 domain-containing protein [Firmicutes bacterium]|jgi:hypothetical protein|nr:MAG: hypothetical protein AA931_00590 [Peptococcaceae bacterium 1109]HHT73243.1 DUF2089 domain-containing protein [Bacillota bacterium]